MPKTHTVNVFPDGSTEFTRSPVMSKVFGDGGDMVRVSDIRKINGQPYYYIHWLKGPFAGLAHTWNALRACTTNTPNLRLLGVPTGASLDDIVLFSSYEDAVDHEIAMLNAMRVKGVSFREAP